MSIRDGQLAQAQNTDLFTPYPFCHKAGGWLYFFCTLEPVLPETVLITSTLDSTLRKRIGFFTYTVSSLQILQVHLLAPCFCETL